MLGTEQAATKTLVCGGDLRGQQMALEHGAKGFGPRGGIIAIGGLAALWCPESVAELSTPCHDPLVLCGA